MGTAVVTGGGRGIGLAIARQLSSAGHAVAVLDVDATLAAGAAGAVGGLPFTCDVADREAVLSVAKEVASALGEPSVLVNNAGIFRYSILVEADPNDLRAVLDVDLLGALWCVQAFAPAMIRHGEGSIVNISSGAATTRSPGLGLYPAAKAALEALTGQLAQELGPAGVRVNAVAPGMIMTEGTEAAYQGDEYARRSRHVPLRRVGEPDDVAGVVTWLCSDAARYVTGQIVRVDGGVTAATRG
jgi:3-oxoacyl-[acyl-carrier protein] reductase